MWLELERRKGATDVWILLAVDSSTVVRDAPGRVAGESARLVLRTKAQGRLGTSVNQAQPPLCCAKIPFSFEVDRYNGQPATV
jgi:hypothetical protein